MRKELSGKKAGLLMFLCWFAYTSAYVGRLNYNASMVEILSQLGTTKEAAGSVSSYFFFAYGVGQLVNGLLSKKYNTKFSVSIALFASCIINLSMTLCTSVEPMKYLWLLNGAFQSVLWSSIVKTQSNYLADAHLSKAVVIMSTTVASGTFASYGLAALFSFLHIKWTVIFYVSSAVLLIAGIVWFAGLSKTGKKSSEEKAVIAVIDSEKQQTAKLKFTPLLAISVFVILVCAVANGFVKDGVTTWVPSILKEEFGVSSSLSIIVTLLLPVLSFFGSAIVKLLHEKQKNENILNGIFYFIAVAASVLIILTVSYKLTALTLLLFGIMSCMMAAVNNVITSIVPLYSRDKIDSGLCAGLLNTFCYVGSTLSITLLGKIADSSGWNGVFMCILIFTVAAFAACLAASVLSKFMKKAN